MAINTNTASEEDLKLARTYPFTEGQIKLNEKDFLALKRTHKGKGYSEGTLRLWAKLLRLERLDKLPSQNRYS